MDEQGASDKVLIRVRMPPPLVPRTAEEIEASVPGDPERPVFLAKKVVFTMHFAGGYTLVCEDFVLPPKGNPESVSLVEEDGDREVLEWTFVPTNFGDQIHFRVGELTQLD